MNETTTALVTGADGGIGRAILTSDHAKYITGQTLIIDGGLTLGG